MKAQALGMMAAAALLVACLSGCSSITGEVDTSNPDTITPASILEADSAYWYLVELQDDGTLHPEQPAFLYVFENGELVTKSNWGTSMTRLGQLSEHETSELYKAKEPGYKEEFMSGDLSIGGAQYFYELQSPLTVEKVMPEDDAAGAAETEQLVLTDFAAKVVTSDRSGQVVQLDENDWILTLSDPTDEDTAINANNTYFGGFKVVTPDTDDQHTYMFVTEMKKPGQYLFALDEE